MMYTALHPLTHPLQALATDWLRGSSDTRQAATGSMRRGNTNSGCSSCSPCSCCCSCGSGGGSSSLPSSPTEPVPPPPSEEEEEEEDSREPSRVEAEGKSGVFFFPGEGEGERGGEPNRVLLLLLSWRSGAGGRGSGEEEGGDLLWRRGAAAGSGCGSSRAQGSTMSSVSRSW